MRRAARVVIVALLGGLAAVSLLVGGALTVARTGWGGDVLRRLALPRVNDAIAGRLEVQRFAFAGDRLNAAGIILRGPEGDVVARVRALEIAFAPLALLQGHVVVRRAEITEPALYLRQGPDGLNLTRALAPKHAPAVTPPPSPGKTTHSSGGVAVDVGALRILGGLVEFRSEPPPGAAEPAPEVQVANLSLEGSARVEPGGSVFAVALQLDAALKRPLQVPLALSVSGHGRGEQRTVVIKANAGPPGSTADALIEATLATNGPQSATVRLSRVHVSPGLVRAFAPTFALRVPLNVTGSVARDNAGLTFSATIDNDAGAGVVVARGAADAMLHRLNQVIVTATNIDLGGVVEGLPRSKLSLTVVGNGGADAGWDPRILTGAIALDMPAGVLNGAAVGPLSTRVNVTHGRWTLSELKVVLPGLAVNGQGQFAPERVSLRASLIASDLARARDTLASFRALALPRIAGRGRVDLSLFGTMQAPGISVTSTFPRLIVDANSVAGLTVNAKVSNVHVPEVARADIHVGSARLGGRSWRAIDIHAQSTPRHIALDARAAGATPLAVSGAGTWGDHWDWFALERLELRYPGARWRLENPTRMILGPDRLAITDLNLRAREQRIHASVDKRGHRIHADLLLAELDLGALPPALLPEGVVLGGHLALRADVGGTMGHPTGRAAITWRDGRFGGYRNLGLRFDGQYDGGRARGSIDADGLGTSLRARFDVPTAWPPSREQQDPVSLELTVPEVELTTLREAFHLANGPNVSGKVGLSLRLDGTENHPAMHLTATARGLTVARQSLGDVVLRVVADRATPMIAALEIRPPENFGLTAASVDPRARSVSACTGTFNVRSDLALEAFTRKLPTTSTLLRTHFDLSGDLRGIPLGALAHLARSPLLSGGTASVRVSATGTADAPTGALNVQVVGATGPRFPATDGRLDAAFGSKDTRVALRVVRGQRPLLSGSGILNLPSRRLADRAALVTAPIAVQASLGPLRFLRNQVPEAAAFGVPPALSGTAGAGLSLDGTLERPRIKVTADFNDARLGERALGRGHALVTYNARRADADVRFQAAGGEMSLTAHADVDLSYPRVVRALNIEQMPMTAAFNARQFELAWLSGFSPDVRGVGGQLTAAISARGRLGRPDVQGKLEWTNGALTLTGLGSYRSIHLKAHGDERAFWLDDLSLASGEGNARLTASASAPGTQDYKIASTMSLRRFPLYSQGQALAILSIDDNLTGIASRDGVKASVKISESHIELTDAKQKKPQPLSVPADVVFMDNGQPVDRPAAAKLAALAASLGMEATAREAVRQMPLPAPAAKPFLTQISVDAPRNLWVRGKDAALELGLGPDFRIEASGPLRIFGQVLVKRGRIDVFGRRFDVQAGSAIRFIGSPDTPRLDVTATYMNENENISVTLTAKGTLDHLKVAVSSPDRPDLTEGQLYALIVTGHLQLGGNTAGSASPSDQAASLVGGLVAAQLQKTLAKRLPLDVLTLQAGEGLSGSRLEAGTYLTSKLYAGYVGRVGANPALFQNRNALHLEYELTRRWSFDGEYGDVGTGTADVIWTKNY